MKDKIKLYEVRPDSLVYAISFVDFPAIESNFIYLSENKMPRVCLEKEDKHLVYGAVLIPDKPIYRYDEEEYYIQFPKETIELLAHNYLKDDNIYSFTEQHENNVDGISVVESWVKLSENDKSVDLGLDVPDGTWLIGAKVENDELWEDIKSGKVKGFSIESFLNFSQIMMNKNDRMKNEELETIEVNDSFWEKITQIIKDAIMVDKPAEEVVEEIKDEATMETEETVVEENLEIVDGKNEEIVQDVVEEVVDNSMDIEEAKDDLQVVIDELNKKIEELNNEIDNLKKENQKLSKQPSTQPINVKSQNIDNKSNFEKMLSIMNGSAYRK